MAANAIEHLKGETERMWKLFKHLGEHKVTVLLIVLLLIGQAYCDLALPSYTSDIVDVGIQQGGIENAVPRENEGGNL